MRLPAVGKRLYDCDGIVISCVTKFISLLYKRIYSTFCDPHASLEDRVVVRVARSLRRC